jgi:hypothetical protein
MQLTIDKKLPARKLTMSLVLTTVLSIAMLSTVNLN